jgi:flavin reductase (DIM6/NTAB) family NADH-FMN oxidoreductase RutF
MRKNDHGFAHRAGAFNVNVLSAGQEDVSSWFANRRRPAGPAMFDGVAFEPGITGCPVLVGAAASFDCWLRQNVQVAGSMSPGVAAPSRRSARDPGVPGQRPHGVRAPITWLR